jgi:hypothetical protein
MRHGPYFIDGFGYREANDEDDLAGLADLLSIEGILDEGANRAPPYYTEDLKNGVAALQRREGFEPADGDVRRGSAMHAVLNELAAGVLRGAFIHDDDGSALDSPVGDGLTSEPAAVRKATYRLAALGFGPRFPDGREPYFVKPYLTKGLGDFQESRGFRRTQVVAPDDDTDRALRQAIADLKRANDGAFRAAHERLSANKEAAEARRRAREARMVSSTPSGEAGRRRRAISSIAPTATGRASPWCSRTIPPRTLRRRLSPIRQSGPIRTIISLASALARQTRRRIRISRPAERIRTGMN